MIFLTNLIYIASEVIVKTMPIDRQLQQRVDQLLMETGEYSPLELLLAEGRMMYSDYEAWMSDDIEYLEDVLFGDPDHIRTMLQQAQDYASKMPMLTAQKSSSATKSFSRKPQIDSLFKTVYRKAQDQPQMDLFVDGGAGNLINGITQALSQNESAEARRLLEQLYDTQPDNTKLNDLDTLVKFTEQPIDADSDIEGELNYLQNQLSAMAQAHLAQNARGYLVPQWRRLTELLNAHPFDPVHPNIHSSFTGIRAMDWHTVKQSIEKEPNWRNHPVLLSRHIQACTRLWQTTDAILSWFYLCWRFPQDADIDEVQADRELKNAWLDFLELEPELPVAAFPAWHLLNKPGLIKILPEAEGDAPDDKLFNTVHRLLETKQSQDSTQEISLRQQLQELDSVFFQHYIKRVGNS